MRADAKQSGPNGEPGICRRWDENGRIAYAPSSRTACLERQFRQFQQGLLDAGPDVGPGSVAAHLLAFEAVVLEADLRAALAATQDRYSWRGQLCLEWSRGGDWLDRRWIGRATASAIATAPQSDAVELSALAAFASAVVPRWAGLPETEVRKSLFEAAEVWAALNVPGFLAAHVLGDVRLQPLPRAALGREQTRLAIADDSLVETSVDQMECLDVVCRGRSSRDTAVVARLRTICSRGRNQKGDHARVRSGLLREMRELVPQAAEQGWVAGLLLGWAMELVEAGTNGMKSLAPATIANYVCAIVVELAEHLNREPAFPVTAEQWDQLYKAILDEISPGNRVNAASAFASLHAYLTHWFDVEPLATGLHSQLDEVPPRANVVWAHELELVQSWLTEGSGDARLRATLSLTFRLATAVRLRTSEILTLRLRNVVDVPGTIEVYPLRRDGRPKSSASVRSLNLDAETDAQLQAWVSRRRDEGAEHEDLLFGDPYRPSHVYRAGTMRMAMSAILRQATGDRNVVFHTLSHSWVTTQAENLAAIKGETDVNPLERLCETTGHFSAVTLRHYLHRHEKWLRESLDEAISRTLKLTSAAASRYTGEPAARLRKRASRAGTDWAGYWRAINAHWNRDHDVPPAYSGLRFVEPIAPVWLGALRGRDAETIAKVLEDLATGKSVAHTSLRSGCTDDEIVDIASVALHTLQRLGVWRPARRLAQIHRSSAVDIFVTWARSAEGFEFSRRNQEKFASIKGRLPSPESSAWISWAEALSDGYLALAPDIAGPLFKWLSDCKLPALNFAISVEHAGRGEGPERSPMVIALRAIFQIAFGVPPKIFPHRAGEGRPRAYLIWCSSAIGEERPAPAACSLHGLHAWMLAASCLSRPDVLNPPENRSHGVDTPSTEKLTREV